MLPPAVPGRRCCSGARGSALAGLGMSADPVETPDRVPGSTNGSRRAAREPGRASRVGSAPKGAEACAALLQLDSASEPAASELAASFAGA